MRAVRVVCAIVLLACGCGSPAEKPPEAPAASAPDADGAFVESNVLEPVPAPDGLFVVGRVKNPERLTELLTEWTHAPVPWQEWLEKEVPTLAPVLAPAVPIDLAVTLDPESRTTPRALFAVSVGVTDLEGSLERLRQAGNQPEQIGKQLYFVEVRGDLVCALARSMGPSRARLICSGRRQALDALAPYMATTLPGLDLGQDDIQARLLAEPLRRRFGKKAQMIKMGVPIALRELALGNARFDAAMADAVHALADETLLLVDELDSLEVKATFADQAEELVTELRLTLHGRQSWSARSLAQSAAQEAVAPAGFWRLPRDAGSASYSVATRNADNVSPIAETISELFVGGGELLGVDSKVVQAWAEAYRGVMGGTGASVYATLETPGSAGQPATRAARLRHTLGYHVLGIEQDQGRWRALIESSVALLNDRSLREALATRLDDEVFKKLPAIKRLPSPRGLPNGSSLYGLDISAKLLADLLKEAAGTGGDSFGMRWLVVPEGDTTWIMLGGEEQVVVDRMRQLLSAQPGAHTLTASPGLESLNRVKAQSAGFATLRKWVESLAAAEEFEGSSMSADNILLAMPNRGRTPLIYRAHSYAEGPAGSVTLTLPRAALEDLVAGAVALAAERGEF